MDMDHCSPPRHEVPEAMDAAEGAGVLLEQEPPRVREALPSSKRGSTSDGVDLLRRVTFFGVCGRAPSRPGRVLPGPSPGTGVSGADPVPTSAGQWRGSGRS